MLILFIEKDQKPVVINDPNSLPAHAWKRLQEDAVRIIEVHDDGEVGVSKDRSGYGSLRMIDPIWKWE